MNTHDDRTPDDELVRISRRHPQDPAALDAMDRLLRRWQGRVYAWCVRQLGDRERALDVMQEVLVSAYRGMPSIEDPARFPGWLFSITRFRCISEIRRRGPRWEQDEVLEGLSDETDGPERQLARGIENERIRDAIDSTLDDEEKLTVVLRYWEGLPIDEVTRLAGIQGSSGARGVLQTARRKLRVALGRRPLGGRS
jgi:RNA polymerase sigma-70 factor (ECF subfamily)